MELMFLGTNAGIPTRERNVTSVVLRMTASSGGFWMFDCGEGTQHQLLRTPLRLTRLNKLFITHLHGDHVNGLAGLISSRSSLGATEPLEIYGPHGLRELLETILRITETHLGYKLQIVEIEDGIIYEDDTLSVVTAKLDHRIDCYGYRIVEKPRSGVLNVSWLTEMGIPAGPIYGQLKAGKDVVLDDGRTIRAAEAVGESQPGYTVAILGDTRPCENAIKLAQGVDVLVHEATFARQLVNKAEEYGHSTTIQAAEIARAAGVRRLLLTHFSSRYKQADLTELEEEAKSVFENTNVAQERIPYTINKRDMFIENRRRDESNGRKENIKGSINRKA